MPTARRRTAAAAVVQQLDLDRIRARREELGLSMDTAGVRAGFVGQRPGAKWNQFEHGHTPDPRISNVIAIARALELAVDDLLPAPRDVDRKPRSKKRKNPAPV